MAWLLFFTRCDVFCDLLQYTHTEKCNLFVKYNKNSNDLLKDFWGMKKEKQVCWRDLTWIWRHLCVSTLLYTNYLLTKCTETYLPEVFVQTGKVCNKYRPNLYFHNHQLFGFLDWKFEIHSTKIWARTSQSPKTYLHHLM